MQLGIVIIIVKKLVRVVFMVQNKLLSKTADSGFPRKVNGFMRQHVERVMGIPIILRRLSVGIIQGYMAKQRTIQNCTKMPAVFVGCLEILVNGQIRRQR